VKGNIYAKPPQPILSEREKRLIDLLIQDGTMASDRCIADFLSNCYPSDNQMGRSHEGIGKYRRRYIEAINKLGVMV
jgi:hypothetical protein